MKNVWLLCVAPPSSIYYVCKIGLIVRNAVWRVVVVRVARQPLGLQDTDSAASGQSLAFSFGNAHLFGTRCRWLRLEMIRSDSFETFQVQKHLARSFPFL